MVWQRKREFIGVLGVVWVCEFGVDSGGYHLVESGHRIKLDLRRDRVRSERIVLVSELVSSIILDELIRLLTGL